MVFSRFCPDFGEITLDRLTPDQILEFLDKITEGAKQQTKRIRYSHLSAFFNFIKINIDQHFQNPCDTPLLRKMFKAKATTNWEIIEKDVIDEIIFKTENPRNRLILELMARGGMRIGEVLKLTPRDVHDRKLTLRDPKVGKNGSTYLFQYGKPGPLGRVRVQRLCHLNDPVLLQN